MEQQISERMAVVENRLDQHEGRLDRHGQRLDKLNMKDAEQDALLSKLCKNLDKNNEITQANHDILKRLSGAVWIVTSLVTGIPAVISLYFALKQIGVI